MKPSSNQAGLHQSCLPGIFVGGMFDLLQEFLKLWTVAI
jgi:hypothetical protein